MKPPANSASSAYGSALGSEATDMAFTASKKKGRLKTGRLQSSVLCVSVPIGLARFVSSARGPAARIATPALALATFARSARRFPRRTAVAALARILFAQQNLPGEFDAVLIVDGDHFDLQVIT